MVFIAVFNILLTLVESSNTGQAHAYAEDLVHITPSLEHQQRQADLVCGFCAFTSLEISRWKPSQSTLATSCMTLHISLYMTGTSHTVQHQDDGYWTRYLGLILDQHTCFKHFSRAQGNVHIACTQILAASPPISSGA
jgi:hypothetical protein